MFQSPLTIGNPLSTPATNVLVALFSGNRLSQTFVIAHHADRWTCDQDYERLRTLEMESHFGHPNIVYKQNQLEVEHARFARSESSNKIALNL
jgi:hypothetical protein